MRDRHTVLSTAYMTRPALGQTSARTFVLGAAVLSVTNTFGSFGLDLQTHVSLATDDPAETLGWLAGRLGSHHDGNLLLWRAEDIVVPSLIAAAEDLPDLTASATFLRAFERALTGSVIDVAEDFGGPNATSFDQIAHQHGFPFRPMTRQALTEAFRTSNYGEIQDHVAKRAAGIWRLWATQQPNVGELERTTQAWLAEDGTSGETRS